MAEDHHMTTREAAAYLKMSVSWLEKQRRRHDGGGPPHHRIPGTRRVFYTRGELAGWLAGHTPTPTPEGSADEARSDRSHV